MIHGKSLEAWCASHPLIRDLVALRETSWFNPGIAPAATALADVGLGADDVADATRAAAAFRALHRQGVSRDRGRRRDHRVGHRAVAEAAAPHPRRGGEDGRGGPERRRRAVAQDRQCAADLRLDQGPRRHPRGAVARRAAGAAGRADPRGRRLHGAGQLCGACVLRASPHRGRLHRQPRPVDRHHERQAGLPGHGAHVGRCAAVEEGAPARERRHGGRTRLGLQRGGGAGAARGGLRPGLPLRR